MHNTGTQYHNCRWSAQNHNLYFLNEHLFISTHWYPLTRHCFIVSKVFQDNWIKSIAWTLKWCNKTKIFTKQTNTISLFLYHRKLKTDCILSNQSPYSYEYKSIQKMQNVRFNLKAVSTKYFGVSQNMSCKIRN